MLRTYSQLMSLDTIEARFNYLKLDGVVGRETFGYDRWINQRFYTSREWRGLRDVILVRDYGCDLGVSGFEIHNRPVIHHMNPMVADDILNGDPMNLDPEYLITTTHQTHNGIHYGDERQILRPFVERRPGDTKLW